MLPGLLCLFLWRVLWTVWSETRDPTRTTQAPAVADPNRLLEIVTGAEWPRVHDAVIGRDPGCGIHLDDQSVSSRNARITIVDGQSTATDLGSTNGTRLNQKLIDAPHPLAAGGLITIGTNSVEARP